jgi:rubredoxin
LENSIVKERSVMVKYVCEVCGYEYDPAQGEGEIAAGTPFEKLPEDWLCPICDAPLSEFAPNL